MWLDSDHGDLVMIPRGLRLRWFRDERGQGLVEFALVFPLIILILFGVFDLGRGIYAYNTLANAARQGARVAAVNQLNIAGLTDCNEDMPIEDPTKPHWQIKTCAAASAVSLGVQPAAVTVTYSTPPNTTLACDVSLKVGCIATVTVTYAWAASTPVIQNIIGPIAMSATSQIPIERVFP